MRSFHRQMLLTATAVVAVCAAALAYGSTAGPNEALIPGVVHETEIHIAPEINGRLVSVLVTPGQEVRKGDILAKLSNPELAASAGEAKAALAKTRADRDNVFAGIRKEEVSISTRQVETAEANAVLARQEYERTATLAETNFASKQKLDELTASLHRAEANLISLREAYARNNAGPTKEERASAEAKVVLAEATLANLEARLAKTNLTAPANGVVRVLSAELGEVISPGRSVMTLAPERERWFTFSIREDMLKGISIGVPVRLLNARGNVINARITELRPLGEFATWRAARASGDHDLNSFLVRADPIEATGELEAGMSVWLVPVNVQSSAE